MSGGGEVALVLVHGGGHDARCWDLLIDAIARTSDVRILAVDLPGRGTQPGPLAGLTVGACVAAVVDQIRRADLPRVVLVGHSMAGMIVPGVADALGPSQVERSVLIAANVAPADRPILDTLPLPVRAVAHLTARWPRPYRLPRPLARALFCNGMSRERTRFVTDRLVPEAGWLVREPIPGPRPGAPPVTWVLTTRDRAVPPALQRRTIAALGSVDDVVEVDAPHDVMVSDPGELARVLLARLG